MALFEQLLWHCVRNYDVILRALNVAWYEQLQWLVRGVVNKFPD